MKRTRQITFNVTIDVEIDDSYTLDDMFDSVLRYFQDESTRLLTARGANRWPTGAMGFSGRAVDIAIENYIKTEGE